MWLFLRRFDRFEFTQIFLKEPFAVSVPRRLLSAEEIGGKGMLGTACLDLGLLHKVTGRTNKPENAFPRPSKSLKSARLFLE
jgi:hypothetical protein